MVIPDLYNTAFILSIFFNILSNQSTAHIAKDALLQVFLIWCGGSSLWMILYEWLLSLSQWLWWWCAKAHGHFGLCCWNVMMIQGQEQHSKICRGSHHKKIVLSRQVSLKKSWHVTSLALVALVIATDLYIATWESDSCIILHVWQATQSLEVLVSHLKSTGLSAIILKRPFIKQNTAFKR